MQCHRGGRVAGSAVLTRLVEAQVCPSDEDTIECEQQLMKPRVRREQKKRRPSDAEARRVPCGDLESRRRQRRASRRRGYERQRERTTLQCMLADLDEDFEIRKGQFNSEKAVRGN